MIDVESENAEMSLYNIQNNMLKLNDRNRVMIQILLLVLCIIVFVPFYFGDWAGESAIGQFLPGLMIGLGLGVVIWTLFKKTFVSSIPIHNVVSLNQSRLNSKVYYLVLSNGRQRNLWTFTTKKDVYTLLIDLTSVNPNISTNIDFSDLIKE